MQPAKIAGKRITFSPASIKTGAIPEILAEPSAARISGTI
jgi:hypothetical protein